MSEKDKIIDIDSAYRFLDYIRKNYHLYDKEHRDLDRLRFTENALELSLKSVYLLDNFQIDIFLNSILKHADDEDWRIRESVSPIFGCFSKIYDYLDKNYRNDILGALDKLSRDKNPKVKISSVYALERFLDKYDELDEDIRDKLMGIIKFLCDEFIEKSKGKLIY